MTDMLVGYYYLHENGSLIWKPDMPGILQDFRESDLVIRWWPFYKGDVIQAQAILKHAWRDGANTERIVELAKLWHIKHCHTCCLPGDLCSCDDISCDCEHPERKETEA